MSERDRDDPKRGWRPPTRRAFVAMLGAAAAALTLRTQRQADTERPARPGPTRWIGHC